MVDGLFKLLILPFIAVLENRATYCHKWCHYAKLNRKHLTREYAIQAVPLAAFNTTRSKALANTGSYIWPVRRHVLNSSTRRILVI